MMFLTFFSHFSIMHTPMNTFIHIQQMILNVQLVFTTVPEMQYAWRKWDSSNVCVLQVTKLMRTLMQVVKVCPLDVGYHL